MLKRSLAWLDKVFGPTVGLRPLRFGRKGFGVCLTLSVAYPILAFMVGWAFGGTGAVGDIEVFAESGFLMEAWPQWTRLITLLLTTVLAVFFLGWGIRKIGWWEAGWNEKSTGAGQSSLLRRSQIALAIFRAVVSAFAVAAAGAITVGRLEEFPIFPRSVRIRVI